MFTEDVELWASRGRVVATETDGTVVGLYSSRSEARRALQGSSSRWVWLALLGRSRYSRTTN